MDSTHRLLNVIAPMVAMIIIPLLLPPYVIYKIAKKMVKPFKSAPNLAGKVVVITGASSGIGEQLAYEYARRGARLSLADRREDRLRAVAAKATQLGSPDVVVTHTDVSDIEHCKLLVDATIDHFGQYTIKDKVFHDYPSVIHWLSIFLVDCLVNNAGVMEVSLFEDSTNEVSTNRSIMDINFWGSVYCTQFAIPHLRKSKGNIVVLSSSGTWFSSPRMSYYNASKAALLTFFETLKCEFGPDIGVTIVTPGMIASEMTTDDFWEKSKIDRVPAVSAEKCAKAIVESACEGDVYLTVPFWCRVGFWFKVLFPELLLKHSYYNLVCKPKNASRKSS